MKIPAWKFALPLIAAGIFTLPAAGQTIPPEDRIQLNAYFAGSTTDSGGQIRFYTDPDDNGSFDTQDQQAGFRYQQVVGFDDPVYDFCADFFTGETDPITYSVAPGFGTLGGTQQSLIRALFSNALPAFNGLFDSYVAANGGSSEENESLQAQYDALQGFAGGMQLALWEIVHEQDPDLTVNDVLGTSGNFKVDFDFNTPGRASLAIGKAEEFLTNLQGGTPAWTDQGGVTYYFAEGGPNQDRLWMVVPEPSSALLGGIGLLALLRRRRA